jgi:hypothetical protein
MGKDTYATSRQALPLAAILLPALAYNTASSSARLKLTLTSRGARVTALGGLEFCRRENRFDFTWDCALGRKSRRQRRGSQVDE